MARLPVDIAELSNRNEMPTGAMQVQQATARSFGGLEAQALGGIGEAVSGLALKIQANKRQSAGFDAEQKFIQLQEEDARAYEEQKRGLAGSGDGFWESARENTNGRYDAFVESLPQHLQEEYRVKAERQKAQRSNDAFLDQYRQQDANSKAVLTDENRKAGLGVQADPETFEAFQQRQHDLIDKSTLPAAEKEAMKREIDSALAVTAAESDAVNNPGRALGATIQPGVDGVKSLVRRKEGFRSTAYWDVNAWRTGYGSDTYTTEDGVVHKVTADSVITQADAERDLDRRINTEFMPAAIGATGADAWAKLSPAAQAVMVSLSYNYGAGAWTGRLKGVADAAKSGDPQAIALAVRGLAGDNSGVNAGRRNSEADIVLSGTGQGGAPPAYLEYLTPDQKSAYERTAQNAFQGQTDAAQAVQDAQRKADQDAALLGIMEGPDPEGAYQKGRQEGLFGTAEEVKRADAALTARQEKDADATRGLDLLNGTVPGDRNSASDKKAVNGAYNTAINAGVDPNDAARLAFDKTNIVPLDYARGLTAGAASRDPAKVEASLVSASNLLGSDPNAFNGVSNSGQLVDDAFEFQRRTQILGESSADATAAILADRARPPLSAKAQDEALAGFRKDVLTPEAVEAGLSEAAENGWGADGRIPAGELTGGDAMRGIYRGLAEEGFRKFGDSDRAMSYAATEMGRRFDVYNGTLIQYPPDKVGLPKLPKADDPYAWVAEQAAASASEEFGQEFKPGQVVLVPIEERGVSTRAGFNGLGTAVPGKPGKTTVPYQIVVMPEDGSPAMMVSGVFLPDIDDYIKTKNATLPAPSPVTPREALLGVEPQDNSLLTPEEAAAQEQAADEATVRRAKVEQLRQDERDKVLDARQNRGLAPPTE